MSTYGPYGTSTGIPPFIGGIDGGSSLQVEDLYPDALTGAWRPRLRPGRYYLGSEPQSRYRYAKELIISTAVTAGQHTFTWSMDAPGPLTLTAPILIDGLTQVSQTVRFAQPVPSTNTVLAGNLVAPEFLQNVTAVSQTSAILWNDLLWWMPLFGGEVITVHRSRRPRSIDVLADQDALLYAVETPDQLTDDRCYCVDFQAGLVYGKVAQAFPAAPFGTGNVPMTYVTVAYSPESDPVLGTLTDSTDWSRYFSYNNTFFTAAEGSSSEKYFNPLRLEEVCIVDTDGLVRVRRGPVDSTSLVSVVLAGPGGLVPCTTNSVQGNAVNALLPDPSQGNTLSNLPYGTTVIVRYYVPNTFALIGAGSGQIRLRASVTADTTLTLHYEGDPYGLAIPGLEQSDGGPDLNPLNHALASGFLWYEDALAPLALAPAVAGLIQVSNPRPVYNPGINAGETIVVRGRLLDQTDTPIANANLHLSCNPSAPITFLSSTTIAAGSDGVALFMLQITGDAGGLPIEISLSDSRDTGTVLAKTSILPTTLTTSFEPCVFVALCEDYLTVGTDTNALTKRLVRVAVLSPDGFPFVNVVPSQLVLTSAHSAFYAPQGRGDASLGAQVSLSCDSPSDLLSSSTVLTVGYAPVSGDILSATYYTKSSRYQSLPLVIR